MNISGNRDWTQKSFTCLQRDVAGGSIHRRYSNHKPEDTKRKRADDVIESLAMFIRVPKEVTLGSHSDYVNFVAYLETKNAQTAVTMKGGATRISVIVRLNPSVALKVGKKALNDNAVTSDVSATVNHHTFQSVTASQNPPPCCDSNLLFLLRISGAISLCSLSPGIMRSVSS